MCTLHVTGTKTSSRVNEKTGYNNTHKENARKTSGRRQRKGGI
jgi:hypothetical protein